jgi:uncharacterized protein (DUF934 family)
MPLLKHGKIIEDSWQHAGNNDAIPGDVPVTISVARWQQDREDLIACGQPLGLRITGDVDVSAVAHDLDHFDLVAVNFPSIADGRGYSQARLLRQRHGFEGELRATGPLVRDVFTALERVGFDAIEARDEAEARAWREAVARITVRLQPDSTPIADSTSYLTAAE